MEPSVSKQDRKQSRRFVLFTSAGSLLGALFLLQFSWSNQWDDRICDSCFRVVHWRMGGGAQAAPQVGFVAINDKSVDPDYSSYSSPWGRGGWVTRSLWTMHLAQMGQIFHPKVLAYDILFRRLGPEPLSAGDKAPWEAEARGNKDFQNELADFADRRSQGQPAPQVLFAFEFPDELAQSTPLWTSEMERQKTWFHRLDRFRLPPGSVTPGGSAMVHRHIRLPMDEILSAPSYFLGSINIEPDADGVYRRLPLLYAYQAPDSLEIGYVPGFTLEAFLLWLGIEPQDLKKPGEGYPCLSAQPGGVVKVETGHGQWTFPVDDQFRMALVPRFTFKTTGKPEVFRPSFVDLLKTGLENEVEGRPEPTTGTTLFLQEELAEAQKVFARIPGMILVVSEAFTGGTDVGNLPLEQGAPRAMVHVLALSNILQGDHLLEFSLPIKMLICLALAAVLTWLGLQSPSRLAGIGSFMLIVCYPLFAAAMLVGRNVQLPWVAPGFLCLSCFALNSYHIYQLNRQGRETMRRLFSSVTSPRILSLLEENPQAFNVRSKTPASMLFSDVESFTALSENLDPADLAALMNRYLSPMTDIIVRYDGYLDKYSGDGIMAIWGVPLPDPDHAYKACAAALGQIEASKGLAETLPDGKPYRFRIRIGINSGMVSAGNMGSTQKTQYTVMGDEVNLAARLEPANKDYGTQIIIGPQTFAGARDRIRARTLDKIIVKGKKEAIVIYELLGLAETGTAPAESWSTAYEQGLDHLWHRRWDEADRMFEQAARLRGGDAPSDLQRARIREYRLRPPPPDWQGEFARLSKD